MVERNQMVYMTISDVISTYADYFGFARTVKPEYDGDFLELLELVRGITYVKSVDGGWLIQQNYEWQKA
jgi:hypothetical protein